jgi:integrase
MNNQHEHKQRRRHRRKRLDGEGSKPREIRPGVWQSTVMLGYKPDGTRNRRTVTAESAKACRQGIARLVRDYEAGRVTTVDATMTVSAWMEHYLEKRELAEDLADLTLKGYRSKVRTYVDATRLGKIGLGRLTPEDLERQYRSMRDTGLTISTVRQFHNILRKGLGEAVRRGVLGHNPADLAVVPKAKHAQNLSRSGESLTVPQARALLREIEGSEAPARWYIGTLLGPRQSEVLGLAWDRVDFEARRISIDRKLYRLTWQHGCTVTRGGPSCGKRRGADCPRRYGGGLFLGEPKTESSVRGLPMPDVIYEALVDQWERHRVWEVQDGRRATWVAPDGEEYDLVFKHRNGRPPNSHYDWDEFKDLLAAAGVTTGTVKDMRHTAATMLLVQGVDPRVVMEIMGWAQATMLKRYQHVLDELRVDAVDKVADALLTPEQESTPPPAGDNVVGLDQWRQARGL